MNTQDCTVAGKFHHRRLPGLIRAFVAATVLLCLGCAPGSDAGGPLFSVDLIPPMLISAETRDEFHVAFQFDEPVTAAEEEITIEPRLAVNAVFAEDREILVAFSEAQAIGESYIIRMCARDETGNTLSFLYNFSGWNPRIPELLINEVNPRGSGNTPDCIELFALTGGNLGGLRLLIGTENEYSGDLIFPALEISEGDYILAHAKSEGIPEEIDEMGSIEESGGLLAGDSARDFWIPGSPGIPGNNGSVVLQERKGGPLIDALLWSDRIYNPEDEKLGWTSDGFAFAEDLYEEDAWISESGGIPTPSDAVDVTDSTATRSLCRASMPLDSNDKSDWHTVPTRGQTFGGVNTDEIYIP